MWIEGEGAKSSVDLTDWNAEFMKLEGELTEEVARKTFGKFLMHNMGPLVYALTGKWLETYQRIAIKGWLQKNFSLTVASRSWGKSLVASHFCYLYCLLNPGRRVIICSATFRSSRQIVERIDEWANTKKAVINGRPSPGGELLRQTIQGTAQGATIMKRQDLVQIKFKNGSMVTALPLGDPDNLRGFRCNALLIDEGLLISQNTIDMVLKPFLAGGANALEKQLTRYREKRAIEAGEMKEEDKVVFEADSKMIMLSSASYKWEELYERYKLYRKIIECPDAETNKKVDVMKGGKATYLVHQFSYEMTNPDLMDKGILEEIEERRIPQSVIDREYRAQFTDESGGFFSARELHECSVPLGQLPCIEMVGDRNAEYVLGIDPSMASDPAGDHFAMCVMKIIAPKGRKIGMVVHQYACAGVALKDHLLYLLYILTHFNIVYVVCDTSHGDQGDFISVCNQSELFKQAKIELGAIEADFASETFDNIVGQVARSYNVQGSAPRIVQKQYFSTSIIKAGNDYLRACLNEHAILFASPAASVGKTAELSNSNMGDIYKTHAAFKDKDMPESGSAYDFVDNQDSLMELVKKECALIEISASALGHISFDLPSHMSRNRKNEKRNRKDSYVALWLANWALRIFVKSQELPPPEDDSFMPVLI